MVSIQPTLEIPALSAPRNMEHDLPMPFGGPRRDARRLDDEAISLRISAEARSIHGSATGAAAPDAFDSFDHAIEASLSELNREAERSFVLLSMSPGDAREAARALTGRVREATESFDFELQAASAEASTAYRMTEDGFSYRASLVVEQATVAWDRETGRFVASVQRVALSMEVESGTLVARAGSGALDLHGEGVSVIQLDAAVPLRERLVGTSSGPVMTGGHSRREGYDLFT